MDRTELIAELKKRAEQFGAVDRFTIMQAIKDSARAIISELGVSLEDVLAGVDSVYDTLIGPIDLPGPDPIIDQLIKAMLKYGIRQSWELLQRDT